VDADTYLESALPPQISQAGKAATLAMQAQARNVKGSSSAIMGTNLAINIALSGSLAVLWGLINSL